MAESPLNDNDLSLLDAYLARLQAGEKPDREALLREHPELASAIDCLEALEVLAPPVRESTTINAIAADTTPDARRCRAISAPMS